MRRLAVALALTLPMMVALARSAWLPNQPTSGCPPRPCPRKRRLSHLHGLTMRMIPEQFKSGQSGEPASTLRGRAVSKYRIQATRLRRAGVEGGPLPGTCGPPGR